MSNTSMETAEVIRQPSNRRHARPAVNAVAWEAPGSMDIAEWIVQGQRLGTLGRGIAWWIGDWVNFGNSAFGEKYARAARITGYDPQTLMNMAYVASRFAVSRRRTSLSWSHHAEVAGLEVEQQEALLTRAEAKRLSVRSLREELRTSRALARKAHDEGDGGDGDPGASTNTKKAEAPKKADEHSVCPKCGYGLTTKPDAENPDAENPA